MLSYCLKCKKNAESKKPKVSKISNGEIFLSQNCEVCNSKQKSKITEKRGKLIVEPIRK